jgi:hypothetical protein
MLFLAVTLGGVGRNPLLALAIVFAPVNPGLFSEPKAKELRQAMDDMASIANFDIVTFVKI